MIFNLIIGIRLLASISGWDAIIVDIESLVAIIPVLAVRVMSNRQFTVIQRIETNPVEIDDVAPNFWRHLLYTVSISLGNKYLDKLLFISPMLGMFYSRKLNIPKSKIGVWPSCVDMNVFDPRTAVGADFLRSELGLSGRLSVLYHGTLSKGRGTMKLINAFAILKEENVKATLVLLGHGQLMEEILRYVQAKHLGDVVKILGPVRYFEVANYLAACDAGIVPLPDHIWWRYQCPIKLLECLAMNRPVIVSDLPAHRWIIGKVELAVYLDGTEPREIADGIRRVLESADELRPELGRNIAAGFSAEAISALLEHEISSSINQNTSEARLSS
jgi:glycosyltransferase involved in cell wall biosynthesis